jgi:GST-like protein
MNDTSGYTPPKVWAWTKPSGGKFEKINRPSPPS